MSAKKKLVWYTIPIQAMGYPIELYPFKGNFVVRQITEDIWQVDHLETGYRVTFGSTREIAIAAATQLLCQKGQAELDEALEKKKQKIRDWVSSWK